MRVKLLFLSAVCGLFVAEQTLAADDVYVDLSVLDAVPQDSIGFVPAQPLFPEVKNTAKPAKAKKVVKAKKQASTKQKAVAHTPKPTAKVKAPTPQKAEPLNNSPKFEPQIEKTIEPEKTEKVEKSLPDSAEIKLETKKEDKIQPLPEPVGNTVLPAPETAPQTETQPQQSEVAESLVISANSDNLPEQNAAPTPKEIYVVAFSADSSELSAESLQKLEEAAQNFDKEHRKKIAIKAYNFDNGEDSFRKKRVSLTRATEVRSYFLSRGFKNFSIKVVNSSADDEYKDTVEVEELD